MNRMRGIYYLATIIFSKMSSLCEVVESVRQPCYLGFFFSVALRPNAGHDLLIIDVSRSHTVGRDPLVE
jgi:hypothetical protein